MGTYIICGILVIVVVAALLGSKLFKKKWISKKVLATTKKSD
jgi:hypothetical protein